MLYRRWKSQITLNWAEQSVSNQQRFVVTDYVVSKRITVQMHFGTYVSTWTRHCARGLLLIQVVTLSTKLAYTQALHIRLIAQQPILYDTVIRLWLFLCSFNRLLTRKQRTVNHSWADNSALSHQWGTPLLKATDRSVTIMIQYSQFTFCSLRFIRTCTEHLWFFSYQGHILLESKWITLTVTDVFYRNVSSLRWWKNWTQAGLLLILTFFSLLAADEVW